MLIIGHTIKFLQELSLTFVELDRCFNNDTTVEITKPTTSNLAHVDPFPSDPEQFSSLGLIGDLKIHSAI